jgi:hypothetical protein
MIRFAQTLHQSLSCFYRKAARRKRIKFILRTRRGTVQKLQLPLVTLAPNTNEMMQPHLQS